LFQVSTSSLFADETRRIFLFMPFVLYSKQAGTFKLTESQVFSPKNTLWQGLEESPFFFLLPLDKQVDDLDHC